MGSFDNMQPSNDATVQQNGVTANDAFPPPPQTGSQPWRATYGQVAPAWGQVKDGSGQTQTQYQPGATTYGRGSLPDSSAVNPPVTQNPNQYYQGGLPVETPQPVQTTTNYYQNPPYNQQPQGDQPSGPAYNPGGQAYNPGGQQTDNGQGGPAWNPNPQQNPPQGGDRQPQPPAQQSGGGDTYVAPPSQLGVLPAAFVGGLGGVAGGSLIPKGLNKLTDSITGTGTAVSTATESGAPGFFAEGGAFSKFAGKGAAAKATELTGDLGKRFEGASGLTQRAAVGWQNNFNPLYEARPALQNILKSTTDEIGTLNSSGAALGEAEAARLAQLTERQTLLSAGTGSNVLNPKLFSAEAGSTIDALKATGLTATEEATLTGQAAKAGAAFPTAEAAAAAASKEVPFLERPMVGNFVKGAAFMGGTILASHLADKLPIIGGAQGSMHLDTLGIPGAFMLAEIRSPGDWKTKAIYTAAAIVGSKVVDKVLPASDHQTLNRIFSPNTADAFLMPAAFMLPAANPEMRLGMVAGAWGFGRMRNMDNTEAFLTTGALAGGTYWAMQAGRISPELGMGVLAAEGAGLVLSRVFKH